jgi:Tol biopolymer transport system component
VLAFPFRSVRSLRVALALCCVSWLATRADAQVNFKLNGPLARSSREGFHVGEVRVAPGGDRVVYSAALDSEADGLFTVRIDGSEAPARLVPVGMFHSGFELSAEWVVVSDGVDLYRIPSDASRAPASILPPSSARTIHGLRISPDGSRVAYIASTDGGPRELFSAATRGGSAPIRIGGTPSSGSVFDLLIGPDGQRVVFTSNRDSAGVIELYSTPLDGSSAPVKLNGAMQGGGIPFWSAPVQISSDGARVVYVADQELRGTFELYGVPIDASLSARKLNGPLVARGDVWSFVIAPDGRRVVYLADEEVDERRELYSVPIDLRSGAVKLNGPLVPDGDVLYSEYHVSPDSRHVSYWAQESSLTLDLRVAPIEGVGGGAAPLLLGGALVGTSTFSPDGQRILYRSGVYGDVRLQSASIATGETVDLTAASAPHAWLYGHVITADSSASVVFLEGPGDGRRLYRVPLLGGSAPVLIGDVPGSAELELPAGGRRVLFRASPTVDWLEEIFSVPVDGTSAPVRLNDPPVTDLVTADVTSVCTNPRAGRAAFVVRAPAGYDGGDDRVTLHSAALEPRSRPLRLFPAAQSCAEIEGCTIDATGEHVVFLARFGDSDPGLWSARLDGELPPVRLDPPGGSSDAFRLTPDGAQVIFNALEDVGSRLYAAPIGGGPLTELTGELADGDGVVALELTPDASRAVFVAGRYSRDFNLFSVPLDGSTAPVRLNSELASGGSVDFDFQIGPDSLAVVYRADEERNEVFELFAAPADGSSGPVKLSGTLVQGGDVRPGFRIAPDGSAVVFRADRTIDQADELFAAPISGASEPVELSGILVAGGDVEPGFELAPDGGRVVFRADLELDERFDLYAAPSDGSLAPVRLSGPLVAGGDVLDVRVGPDGQHAVYRADAAVDERIELYSVRIDGSAPPIALAGPLPAGGDVLERFDLTPDGQRVVYAADAEVDDVFELYAAPLDRWKAARKLSGQLVAGGDAVVFRYPSTPNASFSITSDSGAVLYLGDQESDDVVELFVSFLERPRRLTADRLR